MNNPLLDLQFLKELHLQKNRITYAKIISLNLDETPIEEISGKITQGSVVLNGTSAARRTCSLTMIAENVNIHDYYWGLKTKFQLFIGIKNECNLLYPEIIWFPMGKFVLNKFNCTLNLNTYTITLQGLDKLSLLDGTLGGSITAHTVDFGVKDIVNGKGELIRKEDIELKDIITAVVHTYANEPIQNIIINDLDILSLEVLEYRGNIPLYIIIDKQSGEVFQITINGETTYKTIDNTLIALKDIEKEQYYSLYEQITEVINSDYITIFDDNNKEYYVAKLETGDVAGYKQTPLVYIGNLIGNVGNPVTTAVLDKIVNMLGNYEYFYDIDGRFIFRRRKNYLKINPTNIVENSVDDQNKITETYIDNSAYIEPFMFSFEGNELITNLVNNPDFANLKNDFSLWGNKKMTSGAELPVQLRFAIDKKPYYYDSPWQNIIYVSKEYKEPINVRQHVLVDWREIIYQMAKDWENYHLETNFYYKIGRRHIAQKLYNEGVTRYEQYYTDMLSKWRDIYELMWNPRPSAGITQVKAEGKWLIKTEDDIAGLTFWFDFLDSKDNEVSKYSIENIGQRSKAENNKEIKSIIYKRIPNVVFTNNKETLNNVDGKYDGYIFINLPDTYNNMFVSSSQGKSAYDILNEYLYQYTHCADKITLTSVPIYCLQPNGRIYVRDENSKIEGEYIMNGNITINLSHNGTTSINASKVYHSIINNEEG